jgi:hypothetical protein
MGATHYRSTMTVMTATHDGGSDSCSLPQGKRTANRANQRWCWSPWRGRDYWPDKKPPSRPLVAQRDMMSVGMRAMQAGSGGSAHPAASAVTAAAVGAEEPPPSTGRRATAERRKPSGARRAVCFRAARGRRRSKPPLLAGRLCPRRRSLVKKETRLGKCCPAAYNCRVRRIWRRRLLSEAALAPAGRRARALELERGGGGSRARARSGLAAAKECGAPRTASLSSAGRVASRRGVFRGAAARGHRLETLLDEGGEFEIVPSAPSRPGASDLAALSRVARTRDFEIAPGPGDGGAFEALTSGPPDDPRSSSRGCCGRS